VIECRKTWLLHKFAHTLWRHFMLQTRRGPVISIDGHMQRESIEQVYVYTIHLQLPWRW
jgi:hypothetical protein